MCIHKTNKKYERNDAPVSIGCRRTFFAKLIQAPEINPLINIDFNFHDFNSSCTCFKCKYAQ